MAKDEKQPDKTRRTTMWASILILIGILLTLQNSGIMPTAFASLWPLVLVVIGAFLLWPPKG